MLYSIIARDEMFAKMRGEKMGMNPNEKSLVLSVEEAGRLLGICRASAYALANMYLRLGKGLPCLRLGRRLVVPKVALERLLEASQGKPDA